MASQLIPQGNLNRLFTTLVCPANPLLSLTAPFLGKSMIRAAFGGSASTLIPTATGGVNSPEPYQFVSITASILRTNGMAQAWESQRQLSALLGSLTLTGDSQAQAPFQFDNCSIENISDITFDGTDPVNRLTIQGLYYINSSLFS